MNTETATRPPLPIKASNRAEMDSFNYLTACLTDLAIAQETMEKRVRLIPGGWRNLRMITSVLKNLLVDIKHTFPPEKRAQIQRTAQRMRHKLVIGPQVFTDDREYVISDQDMGVLTLAASRQCQLCMGTPAECKQCELGKTLDSTSFISRGDRAWWEVFERAARVDIGVEPGYEGADAND